MSKVADAIRAREEAKRPKPKPKKEAKSEKTEA